MLNSFVVTILIFNFTVVSLILWLVTLLEVYVNKNTNHFIKSTVYECGFFSVSKNTVPISLNTIILVLFVFIYEIEFIILLPVTLNWFYINITNSINLIVIVYVIFITLVLDFYLNKLNWVF